MDVNEAQREQWNGTESDHWVLHADRYDAQLVPFADALFEQLDLSDRDAVLDIGCGCGVTTLTASRQAARAVGADLSEPMLEVARARMGQAGITNAEFLVADAQTHDFGGQKFTAVISRFGVMFFDDQVAAFSNLHEVLVPAGRLSFVCWQPLVANDWLLVPGLAAAQYVSLPDFGDGNEPGMFALSDDERLREILSAAGFSRIVVRPFITTITLGGGGDVEETLSFLLGTGIARALLADASPEVVGPAVDGVRQSLSEHFEPGVGVRLGAAAWIVSATA